MASASLVQPRLRAEIDGQQLPEALAATISLVLIRQALGVPAAAELDFTDPDRSCQRLARQGAKLALRVEDTAVALFSGSISAIEEDYDGANGLIVRVRAYDALQAARRRRRVRTLEQASAVTVAAEIAAACGVGFSSRHAPPRRSLVIQRGESDFELLRTLSADAGVYPILHTGAMHLVSLADGNDPITLRIGRELHSARIRRSMESAVSRIDIVAWDPATLAPYRHQMSSRSVGSIALAGSDHDGAHFTLDRLMESAAEAAAFGEGILSKAAASATTAAGLCVGSTALVPGRAIRLAGAAGEGNDRFVITEAIHRFDAVSGYTTRFDTVPPPDMRQPRGPVITRAMVSAINDPEELGRCRVRLETFTAGESGWFQVLTPGAGKGKGIAALPEIGDEVLIVLPDGDLGRGFVLGGVYGQQPLPHGAAAQKSRPFVLRTADGQALELSGAASTARLSTSNGSMVELSHDRMHLAATTDLVIEAPGRTMTIRAAAIKFEQG